jgi:hypothetical protein
MSTLVFFEPEDLATSEGMVFRAHPVQKHGEPLLTGDLPDEKGAIGLYGTVFRDPWSGRFRMWYTGTVPRTLARYAESEDGITWTKPNVADPEWVPKECRNAVMPGQFPVVIPNPDADEAVERYRMFIWEGRMDLLRSEDGIKWQRHPARWNPVWPLEAGEGLGEVPIPFWDPQRREYIAMTRIWTGPRPKAHERSWDPVSKEYIKSSRGAVRMVGRGTSPDGIFWTGPDTVYNCDDHDPLGSQPYEHAAWPYAGRHLGLLGIFHSGRNPDASLANTLRLYFAWSTDGCYTWKRLPDRLAEFIPLGGEGEWDGGMITQPTRLIEVGDEWWCYYGGHSNRHVLTNDRTQNGIGLATLPKGRLIGMTPESGAASATTRPVKPGTDTLRLNADATHGAIRVTVLDGGPGAPVGASDPMTGDGIRQEVTWNGTPWKARVADDPVRLRLDLAPGAKLYECTWE